MRKICDTEEEAERMVAEHEIDMQPKFCPVIRDMCRKDCECWGRSMIHPHYQTKFAVTFSGCTNPMLTGDRCCDN